MVKYRQQPKGVDTLGVATLIAVGVVLAVSILNLRAAGRMEDDLERKLERVEDRIAQVGNRLGSQPSQAAAPAQATPPRRGPDPNRVYTIKTAGRPTKGPASAPITIAEFSDFQ